MPVRVLQRRAPEAIERVHLHCGLGLKLQQILQHGQRRVARSEVQWCAHVVVTRRHVGAVEHEDLDRLDVICSREVAQLHSEVAVVVGDQRDLVLAHERLRGKARGQIQA
eukprot:2490400-Rhodomonas_salina.1